ncbi:MAG: hypothetical protein QXG98_00495 [Candidatus Micrarchaeia archaeon]
MVGDEFDVLTLEESPLARVPVDKLVKMFFAREDPIGAVVSELVLRARRKDKAALEGLLRALQENDEQLSQRAITALGLVGEVALEGILSAELLDPSKCEGSVRNAAVAALAEIGKNDWDKFVQKLFAIASENKLSNNLTGLIDATITIASTANLETARQAVDALMFLSQQHGDPLIRTTTLDNLNAIAAKRKELFQKQAGREEEAREKQRIFEKNANGHVKIDRVPMTKAGASKTEQPQSNRLK